MFTQDTFDSDGTRLHYIDYGGAGQAIVLLAGLGGTAHIFRGLAPRLAGRFRVVALTRRGHGKSERPDRGYELDTLVEDIRRFLDHLGMDRSVLIGHSFAAIEIPRFAIRYPDRIEAAVYLDGVNVLLEPAPEPNADPVLSSLDMAPEPDDLESSRAYLDFLRRTRADLASIWCDAIEADRLEDLTMEGGHVIMDGHGAKVTAEMFAGLDEHRNPAYGRVAVPQLALVLAGREHPFLPSDATDELRMRANEYYVTRFRPWLERRTNLFRSAAPNARVVEMDTSNHTLFIAKEDETVAAIFEFLE